ncbi:hypothetical protein BT69DRAFT_1343930 [Atractiella rhizophila]|nr:hypothetical protein BT69DRAFT_1343930 [Atractiella rhizophila]
MPDSSWIAPLGSPAVVITISLIVLSLLYQFFFRISSTERAVPFVSHQPEQIAPTWKGETLKKPTIFSHLEASSPAAQLYNSQYGTTKSTCVTAFDPATGE